MASVMMCDTAQAGVTTKASHYRLATCKNPFPRPLISTGRASVVAGQPLPTAENLWQEPFKPLD